MQINTGTETYSKVGIKRLRKLAHHLIEGKLGHKNFDITRWNDSDTNRCGTRGCAVGECPIVFVNEWKFDMDGNPILRGKNSKECGTMNEAQHFFSLTGNEALGMFMHGHALHVGSKRLPAMSFKIKSYSVGRRILKYCDIVEGNK